MVCNFQVNLPGSFEIGRKLFNVECEVYIVSIRKGYDDEGVAQVVNLISEPSWREMRNSYTHTCIYIYVCVCIVRVYLYIYIPIYICV